jgi:hypothetical protein
VESVASVIEVKSTIDQGELQTAIAAARNLKTLRRSVTGAVSCGYIPPASPYYAVAHTKPAKMKTVRGWIDPIHNFLGITPPALGPTHQQRISMPSHSIDGVFVLGKGFLIYDNAPFTLVSDATRAQFPTSGLSYVNINNIIFCIRLPYWKESAVASKVYMLI